MYNFAWKCLLKVRSNFVQSSFKVRSKFVQSSFKVRPKQKTFHEKVWHIVYIFSSKEVFIIEFVIAVIDPTHILAGIIIFSFQNFQITFKKHILKWSIELNWK